MKKLDLQFDRIPRKLIVTIALLWIVIIGVSVYLFISVQSVMSKHEEVKILEATVSDIEARADNVRRNTTLTAEEMEEFNQKAAQLIPSEESYFSLISAMEQLSQKTGFVLSDYNIDLASEGQNKVAITVKGTGDIEDFLNFLEVYNYAGGRLVTVEQFDVPLENPESYNLVLNFYHNISTGETVAAEEKPTTFDPNIIPDVEASSMLSPDDISFVRDVLEKTR